MAAQSLPTIACLIPPLKERSALGKDRKRPCVQRESILTRIQSDGQPLLYEEISSPFFRDAERAALALTEAVTRLSDRDDPVPDAIWDEAARHYDEPALAALVLSIAAINVWNRLNVATRQIAGVWKP